MARHLVAARLPAPVRRWPRAGAVWVLGLAVVVLHGALLDGLLSAGHGAPPALSATTPVRVLDVVLPRVAVPPVPDLPSHVTAAAAQPVASPAPAPGPGPDTLSSWHPRVDRPSRSEVRAAVAATAAPLATAATPDAAAAANLLPPPRDDAPMPAEPPPVYATRMPAPATLRYALARGVARGEATLSWQPDAAAYELMLQATLPQGATLEQRSQGFFDDAGLAPLRLADRRRGRSTQAVNFQRAQGRITFSGPRWEYPLVPGVQDRLSWIVQLVAIASATPQAPGDEVVLQVVGARGAAARWRFRVDGAAPSGVLHLVREPDHLYDQRLELWLDPVRGHWPVRMRQVQVPGGDALDWVLEQGPIAPGGT